MIRHFVEQEFGTIESSDNEMLQLVGRLEPLIALLESIRNFCTNFIVAKKIMNELGFAFGYKVFCGPGVGIPNRRLRLGPAAIAKRLFTGGLDEEESSQDRLSAAADRKMEVVPHFELEDFFAGARLL